MEAFSGLYLVVLGVSLSLLVVAPVFGFGHDSDFSPEVDSEIDADVGGATAHLESDGPSWLSSRVILGAAAGFGAFGLGAQAVGLPVGSPCRSLSSDSVWRSARSGAGTGIRHRGHRHAVRQELREGAEEQGCRVHGAR